MNLLNAIILGIVQGVTEFLPISSSAHVQFAALQLGVQFGGPQITAFIATIQLGTEAAVLLYFFKDIVRIVKAWFRSGFSKSPEPDAKLGWYVIIGSLPVVIAGLLFKDYIETTLRTLQVAGYALIGFGLLLLLADLVGKKNKGIEQLTVGKAIVFGIGQMLAVIPGVSRSGGTLTAGLFMGFDRKSAARYSFLLAIPAVLASGIYEFATTYQEMPSEFLLGALIGTVTAFVVGYLTIAGFLKYISNHSVWPFVVYRVIAGAAFIFTYMMGNLSLFA